MPMTISGTTITYPDNTTQNTTTNYQATDGNANYPGVASYVVGTYMLVNTFNYNTFSNTTYAPLIDSNITSTLGSFNSSTTTLGPLYSGDPTQMARTFGQGYYVTGTNNSIITGNPPLAVWTGTWVNRGSNPVQMLVQRVA